MWSVHMFQPQWSRDHLWECVPANTRRWTNAGLLLGQRLRRWPNINPTLVQRLVFAGFFFSFISPNLSSQTCQRGALVRINGRQFDQCRLAIGPSSQTLGKHHYHHFHCVFYTGHHFCRVESFISSPYQSTKTLVSFTEHFVPKNIDLYHWAPPPLFLPID